MKKPTKKPNVLITGGAGFLGRRLIEELMGQNSPLIPNSITSLDIHSAPRGLPAGVDHVTADIRDYAAVKEACRNIDIVFHLASIVDWGTHSKKEVMSINVEGTRNVIRACEENGVNILVYTSSLDAIFSGKPTVDVDESIEYPKRFPNVYCQSKAEAEALMSTIDKSKLLAVTLRPADIFGEGDPFHIGALMNMAEKNFYVRIGDGTHKSQHVYVGNAAYAHILAAKALFGGNTDLHGRKYFITDAPPSNFFTFFDSLLTEAGYTLKPENVWIPGWLMYAAGTINEIIAFLIRPFYRYNPKVSRFAVTYTCTDFTFTSKRAEQDFGFAPKYSEEEAHKRTAEFYSLEKN